MTGTDQRGAPERGLGGGGRLSTPRSGGRHPSSVDLVQSVSIVPRGAGALGECPSVDWPRSYAILGPHDYLDIFRANDIEAAARVLALVRTFGHAQTEIWPAVKWARFKEIVRNSRPKEDA